MVNDWIFILLVALIALTVFCLIELFTVKATVELLKETVDEELEYNAERYLDLEKRLKRIEVIVDGETD